MNPNPTQSPRLDVDWHYDHSGHYAYIMLRGRHGTSISNDNVVQIISKFKDKEIPYQTQGTSFRPADNGIQYNYYIRLGVTEEINKINFSLIRSVLDEILITNKNVDLNELSEQDVEEYKAEIKNLNEALSDERDKFNQTVNDQREKLRGFRDGNDQLSQKIDQLKSENDQLRLKLNKESENYCEILLSIDEERNKEVEELKLERQREYKEFDKERDELISDLQKAQQESRTFQQQKGSTSKLNKNEREQEFSKILNIILPHLNIDKGAISFMLHEIRDYKFILKKLLLLNNDPQSVKSKSVQDKLGWLEITKVSTGESDAGRIYYKKSNDTGTYNVRIGDKSTQPEDIEKLG